jgi:hypothetical protein
MSDGFRHRDILDAQGLRVEVALPVGEYERLLQAARDALLIKEFIARRQGILEKSLGDMGAPFGLDRFQVGDVLASYGLYVDDMSAEEIAEMKETIDGLNRVSERGSP